MRKFKFGKLVRDKIVASIEESGNRPIWKTLTDEEYIIELKKKIIEESKELVIDDIKGEELLKEIADIQEIVDNLLSAMNVTKDELQKIQQEKNHKNGSFKKRHYIDYVEAKDDAKEIEYYLKYPEKYPELK